jgi:hypothetical protein
LRRPADAAADIEEVIASPLAVALRRTRRTEITWNYTTWLNIALPWLGGDTGVAFSENRRAGNAADDEQTDRGRSPPRFLRTTTTRSFRFPSSLQCPTMSGSIPRRFKDQFC